MATPFLEQQVEAALVAALNTALGTSGTAYGFWQPSAPGTDRNAPMTHVAVRCAVRFNASQNSRIINLNVTVTVMCAVSDSASGDQLTEMAAPVLNLLHSWNLDSSTMSAALSVANVFRADGMTFQDAGDPDFSADLAVWYCPIQIKLAGVVLAP